MYVAPDVHLDTLVKSRGYSTTRRSAETTYDCEITELQKASYTAHLIQIARNHNVDSFRKIMSSGISPNPYSSSGESLINTVCHLADPELLRIMLDNGAEVCVVDKDGRTPLHDACRAENVSFEVVEMLLSREQKLLHLTDNDGKVPLSYVRQNDWPKWIAWLESKKDVYWPVVVQDQEKGDLDFGSDSYTFETLPDLHKAVRRVSAPAIPDPNELLPTQLTRKVSVQEPVNALPLHLARRVSTGQMSTYEARYLSRASFTSNSFFDDSSSDFGSASSSTADLFSSGEMRKFKMRQLKNVHCDVSYRDLGKMKSMARSD